MRLISRLFAIAAILLTAAATPAAAGTTTPNDATLSGANSDFDRTMQGFVGPRSYDLIMNWLRANPHRNLTLHLNSPGGRASSGAMLYDAIEAQGHVSTDVAPGQFCLSACAYLWLAGHARTVADRALLGFHSAYCDGPCDPTGVGIINQSLLDILARTEPDLAVLVSNTGAMINGNHLIALARRENGHWSMRTFQPPS